MDNYIYIVASLPDLTINFGSSQFSYTDVQSQIVDLLSESDKLIINLFEEGFADETLNADFYAKTSESKNRFMRQYFTFDALLRNKKVTYLASQLQQNASKYMLTLDDIEFEEEKKVNEIFALTDFLQREQQLDMLKWQKADDLALSDYFNLSTILSFLVKAHIVQRWAQLDKQTGEQMFRQLLGEVRGTFDGLSTKN